MLEFIYVDDGEALVTVAGQVVTIGAGTFIAVAGFVPHSFEQLGSSSWLVQIPIDIIRGVQSQLEGHSFKNPIIRDEGGELLSCIQLMNAVIKRTGSFSGIADADRAVLISDMASMLVRSAIAVCGLTEKHTGDHLLLDAVNYLGEHFREPIRVAELARMLLCSQYTLSSGFRETFGMSISEYLGRLRAGEVRRLLAEEPELTLQEAAARAGFGSLRSLHRVYLKEFGCTPRKG